MLSSISNAQSMYELLVNSFRHAEYLYKKHSYAKAAIFYERSYWKDTTNKLAVLRAAQSHKRTQHILESRLWFRKLEGKHEKMLYAPDNVYDYFDVLKMTRDTAMIHFLRKKVLNREMDEATMKVFFATIMPQKDFYSDSATCSVTSLKFNSKYDEICPAVYNKQLIFISNRPRPSLVNRINERDSAGFFDLYSVPLDVKNRELQPEKWNEIKNILHEGPITFYDNFTKAIVSRDVKAGDWRRLSLFQYVKNKNGDWDLYGKLPFCEKEISYSHPFYHEPTKTLYFVRQMEEDGNTDIFKSQWADNQWSTPVTLGTSVNSFRSEMFPFVTKENRLYFSSNGLNGLGGYDLFSIQLDSLHTDAENLGYPINSLSDDLSLIILANGRDGYFASNRNHDNKDDLYRFLIHQIRYNVFVKDKLKSTPIKSGSIKVTDYKTDQVIINKNITSKNELVLKPGRKYIVEISVPNFRTVSFPVLFTQKNDTTISKSVFLEKINKTFVKGKVLEDGELVSNAKIKILDISSDSVETVYSKSNGTFVCEINRDTTTYFFMSNSKDSCVYRYVPLKKFKRGSGVAFVDLDLKPLKLRTLEFQVIDSTNGALDSIWIRNDIERQKLLIYPSNIPISKLTLWDRSHYSILTKNESNEIVVAQTLVSDKLKRLSLVFGQKRKFFVKVE